MLPIYLKIMTGFLIVINIIGLYAVCDQIKTIKYFKKRLNKKN